MLMPLPAGEEKEDGGARLPDDDENKR